MAYIYCLMMFILLIFSNNAFSQTPYFVYYKDNKPISYGHTKERLCSMYFADEQDEISKRVYDDGRTERVELVSCNWLNIGNDEPYAFKFITRLHSSFPSGDESYIDSDHNYYASDVCMPGTSYIHGQCTCDATGESAVEVKSYRYGVSATRFYSCRQEGCPEGEELFKGACVAKCPPSATRNFLGQCKSKCKPGLIVKGNFGLSPPQYRCFDYCSYTFAYSVASGCETGVCDGTVTKEATYESYGESCTKSDEMPDDADTGGDGDGSDGGGGSGGGSMIGRLELAKCLSNLSSGDIFVVYKIDRLARSLSDLLEIISQINEKGATIKSLTEPLDTTNSMGVFVLQILGAVAELERSIIRERSIAGQKSAILRGRNPGRRRSLSTYDEMQVVDEYLFGDVTYSYLADKYSVSSSVIKRAVYRVTKYGDALGRLKV